MLYDPENYKEIPTQIRKIAQDQEHLTPEQKKMIELENFVDYLTSPQKMKGLRDRDDNSLSNSP